jgi:prepilin-type N-terminal cleavage/methylation domain-containing protein
MRTLRAITWNSRGFTLAELAIVMAIIMVAVSLTLPLLGKTGDADLRASGRKLAGTFKHLYNEAVLEGMNHRLSFDLDRAVFFADRQELDGEWRSVPGRKREQALPGSVNIKQIHVKGRGEFSTGAVGIQIYPVGWVDETVLHLQDGKHRLTMLVSALTGTTEFFDGHRELF